MPRDGSTADARVHPRVVVKEGGAVSTRELLQATNRLLHEDKGELIHRGVEGLWCST